MIDRYFREHPRCVGETYLQHLQSASSFAGAMLIAGLACFIHGIVPRLFENTGSRAIERLYDRMIATALIHPQTSPSPRSNVSDRPLAPPDREHRDFPKSVAAIARRSRPGQGH